MPTLNEEQYIAAFLDRVFEVTNSESCIEVLISDGGSSDTTLSIVEEYPSVRLCHTKPGRASQMNAAAELASGKLLWFLHADTLISAESVNFLLSKVDKGAAGEAEVSELLGAFRFSLDIDGWRFRLLERLVDIRTRFFKMPYGDQGIFISRTLFSKIGGYPEQDILEDVALWRRAAQEVRPVLRKEKLVTSGRFWHHAGLFKTTLVNASVMIAFRLGVSANTIARFRNNLAAAGRRKPRSN